MIQIKYLNKSILAVIFPLKEAEIPKAMLKKILLFLCLIFLESTAMAETLVIEIEKRVAGTLVLTENDAAKDFVKKLPLTLNFEDYATTERIAYLKEPLSLGSSNQTSTPNRGDFSYYAPWGNIAVFRKDFRESEGLIYLGKLSEDALHAIETSAKKPVTLRLKEGK